MRVIIISYSNDIDKKLTVVATMIWTIKLFTVTMVDKINSKMSMILHVKKKESKT